MSEQKLPKIFSFFPEVQPPTQKVVPFEQKLKWTLVVLISFFVLGMIPLFGLGNNALQQFEYLSIILGAEFGSILSLGIGPIVTASIVLQLLVGAGLLKININEPEGRAYFENIQKLLSIAFIILEATLYVYTGGLAPNPNAPNQGLIKLVLIFQLFLGGMLILFMDEVSNKWGFGSGISLFIAAGVSKSLFIALLSPLKSPANPEAYIGAIPMFIKSLTGGDIQTASLMFMSIFFTFAVFAIAVYLQAMKVEIPLSFGRVRGYGIRWPLNFIYTSNIPVILVAALMANIQLIARLLQNMGRPILGTFAGNTPTTGIVAWLNAPNIMSRIVTRGLTWLDVAHALVYMLFMILGAVLFSILWVQTSGMDARSQAEQILASGLQVPGFRRDERILERILERYIFPLTVMGAIAVGFLAAFADISGALSRGTGILLAVMIIYQFYERIAREHAVDMNPTVRKFIKG
ncbi:MAG: preprotein translocase subunit SecY [Candidatus Woesearchaeota archaeon]